MTPDKYVVQDEFLSDRITVDGLHVDVPVTVMCIFKLADMCCVCCMIANCEAFSVERFTGIMKSKTSWNCWLVN